MTEPTPTPAPSSGRDHDGFATWGDGTPRPAAPRARGGGFGTTVLPDVDRSQASIALRPRDETRFVPLTRLGEGGLGEVFAATDNDIGRTVAIKRIRADRSSAGAVVRFLQEIRTVGYLEHANIVPIHDVGRDEDGALYFVMRHVDGETLEAIIDRLRAGDPETHRRYGFERRLRIVAAVLEALEYAHANGVIHRDVKPANVMVGRYGEVMLLDWGIARFADRDDDDPSDDSGPTRIAHTRVGALIGTPAYMSPEQARGEPVDARSDLYSASVMLHELLSLHHYLEDLDGRPDEMIAAVPTRPVPFASERVDPVQGAVPAELSWFIDKGVAKDPNDRFQSATEMLDRLARRAEGDIPVQCPVTFTKRATGAATRFFERHVAGVMVAAAMAAIGGLAGLAALVAAALAGIGVAFAV